jgi:hypothetical protein
MAVHTYEINGLDVLGIISTLSRRKQRHLAILLSKVEDVMNEDSEEFAQVRKYILDSYNDYVRSAARLLLADDIEGLVDKR